MKKFIITCLSLTSLLGINLANAKLVIITGYDGGANPDYWVPATANAVCGDSIKWVKGTGTHTTESTTIPSGAVAWASPTLALPSVTPGFIRVLTVVGTYNYGCHIAVGNPHMFAKIIVTCANGVPSTDHQNLSLAYPSPFYRSVTIETTDADMIILYNLLGNKMKSVSLEHGQTKVEVDAVELTKGIYFYSIIKEGVIVETRKLVKN